MKSLTDARFIEDPISPNFAGLSVVSSSLAPLDQQAAKPLLRWAGGKQQLVKKLLELVPHDVRSRRYVEPFLGAASLFLAISPKKALISDSNRQLIEFYRRVRDRPDGFVRELAKISRRVSMDDYYSIREEFNSSRVSVKKSARFLYLNRTCFNGIYRVNRNGDFNVPYGHKLRPWFPDATEVHRLSRKLREVDLECLDYRTALRQVIKGDFVYLDPPYVPLSNTAFFSHYTAERFGPADQLALAKLVREIDAVGASVMITNSDTTSVRLMYKDFRITPIDVRRYVTCKQRHHVTELIITNY